jgi:alpha-L-rhamnosidase
MSSPRIVKLTFARNASPIGIGQARPALAWRFEQDKGTGEGWTQKSYELSFSRNGDKAKVYKVSSSDNFNVEWPKDEPSLKSRDRVEVKVRAEGGSGWTEWYAETVEAGLLESSDWTASVVAPDTPGPANIAKRPFHLRKTFKVDKSGLTRVYATALGVYELKINGKQIGDHVMAPGWQSYNHRLHYQTYEVPEGVLSQGENSIEAVIGEGWYSGRLTWMEQCRNLWGTEIGLQMQLEVDGKPVVTTSDDWEWSFGPLIDSQLYDGEVYDASITSKEWKPTKTISLPSSTTLIAPEAPPIRRTQELKPKKLITTASGKKIIDFGQNLVGWVKLKNIPKKSGRTDCIVMRFAEVLEKSGEMGMRPLRSAKCTDKIYLGEEGIAEWEPKFTTHGFRFCEITGAASVLEKYEENITAVVVHSDMERLGDFECSHPLITKLHQNVVWGLRGNFVGLPTDCPQRDER